MYSKKLSPVGGWENFNALEELEDKLWISLGLKERNEGAWKYLSFTNWNQIWELDDDEGVLAMVQLSTFEEDSEKIKGLTISTRTSNFENILDLEKLMGQLGSEFNIIIKNE